ncbi:MAG: peptidoglycan-binding domain-containing protein [Cyanobacteria bacterium P01_A01_bin.135]
MPLPHLGSHPNPKRRITATLRRTLAALLAVTAGTITFASGAIAQFILQRNDEGPEVTQLQRDLQAANFYNGPISGIYGSQTEQAVIQLQIASRLEADGVFGPLTRSALSSRLGGTSNVPGSPTVGTPIPVTGSDGRVVRDDALSGRLATNLANASCANFSSGGGSDIGVLQRGDVGNEVRRLQQRLDDLGYSPGVIDGVFGQDTQAAVIRFQRDRGLTADGIVGSVTAQRLGLIDDGVEVGQPAINNGPYAVVVPAGQDDIDTLATVREEEADACFARSRLGSYIYAGGFAERSDAESRSLRLRALGLDARVDFRRSVRAN